MENIYDMKHVAGTSAWALLKDGKPCGKVVANWSDNPAGSVCTAMVYVYNGTHPDFDREPFDRPAKDVVYGKASGYGYCKLSSAIGQALRQNYNVKTDMDWVGESAVIEFFNARGIEVFKII